MKVAIECRSPLLQKSLENFLEGHLSSPHSCDILLSDEALDRENLLRIGSDEGADIMKPFSKSQLFLKLEQFYKVREDASEVMTIANELDSLDEGVVETLTQSVVDLQSLEEKIERLSASYVQGVMSLVREYHGQK